MSSMQTDRWGLSVVALSGQLYAIGGYNNGYALATVERYDPQGDCWTTIPSLQTGRTNASAAVLNGKIFVCGGRNSRSAVNTVEVYDPIAKRWDFLPPINEPRWNALVVVHAGKLWAFGGASEKLEDLSSVEVYDNEENWWSYVFEMLTCKGFAIGGILLI